MKPTDVEIVQAIAGLQRAAPNDFDKFLAAFRAYNADLKVQLVSSPVDLLQVAQGRARNGDEVLALLSGSLKTSEQILDREKAKQYVRPSNTGPQSSGWRS